MRKRVRLLSPMLDRIRRLGTSAAVGRGSTRVAWWDGCKDWQLVETASASRRKPASAPGQGYSMGFGGEGKWPSSSENLLRCWLRGSALVR